MVAIKFCKKVVKSRDFENYFTNKLINMGRYLSHLKHKYRSALSDIKLINLI